MSSTVELQVESAEGFRLSPQQKTLWSLIERYSHLSLTTQCTVEITGLLNVDRLQEAVLYLRRRYEILRTRFAFLQSARVPVQVISEEVTGLNQRFDLRNHSVTEANIEIGKIAEKLRDEAGRVNGTSGVHFALASVNNYEHVLLVTSSALCADGPALTAIVGELRDVYSGEDLPESGPLQYADVSEWQNQLLEEDAETKDRYWNSPDFSPLRFPHLPFELKSPEKNPGFEPATLVCDFPENIAICLQEAEHQAKTSAAAVLIAAFKVCISCLAGLEEFLISAEIDGRTPAELRNAIGLFAKSMPIPTFIRQEQAFVELAQKAGKALEAAAYDHAFLDVAAMESAKDSPERCLNPIVFRTRVAPAFEPASSTEWKIRSSEELVEPFELAVTATISSGCLKTIKFSWDKSRFAEYEIAMLSLFYTNVLCQVAANPHRPLRDFSLDTDVMPLLLSRGGSEEKALCGVHEWIEYQCERAPRNIAAICGQQKITYSELNERASLLAHRLHQLGAAPDRVIAIVAQRSINFIVAILGVLKSGAAWLPIDPDTPAERIKYMVGQASAIAILSDNTAGASLQQLDIPVVSLDTPRDLDASVASFIPPPMTPEQLAYVIFTSGSTGQPKGVAIEHRQLMAYVQGFRSAVKLPDGANYALVSTMAADLGHTPVFAALASGGCIHVIPPAFSTDMAALAQYFLETRVDCIKIVPAHLEALCHALPESADLAWSAAIVGGEPLKWELAQVVRKLAPGCVVVNEYGPTETTVGVISGPAEWSRERFTTTEVPIGNARSGVSAYVLDEHLRPVPAWVAGDLYIGGSCVGRGYTGEGGLTAERFLPDPFHPVPGSRMYCTGDRARYRPDEIFEFLGRRDGQIKLRGYRIEPGEIEATLCRHAHVQHAVVKVVESKQQKYLAAWVATGTAKVPPQELRRFAAKSLPAYMVPQLFTCVDQLKLTANGKIDRQTLPPVSEQQITGNSAPLDEVEESLLAVWRKVLGKEDLTVEENYFALGGDSLRVVQVVHEARRYGINIRAMDILRHQTIRNLRKALHQEQRGELFPNAIPEFASPWPQDKNLLSPDVVDFYPISGSQTFVLQEYARGGGIFHIQECFDLEDNTFSEPALKAAFHAVVERHPALRTVFYLGSTPPMQCVKKTLGWEVVTKDISDMERSAQDTYITEQIRIDRSHLFDTADTQTALFRVRLFLRSATQFSLLFSCHHAIMDGWGHRTFLNQLVETYGKIKSGNAPDLGTPDDTYHQFVKFEKAITQSPQALHFWQSYLAGAHLPSLPCFAATNPEKSDERPFIVEFSVDQIKALWRVAEHHAISMQALMLAAWLQALREWSGEALVSTGVISNGRSEYLTDPLSAVGLFWNIVPCISRKELPLLQQAVDVQKDLIEIQPYSAYPLSMLMSNNGGKSLFYSVFKYLNFWNTKEIPEETGLRLMRTRASDRYPFALSCSALVSSSAGHVELECDLAVVSIQQVNTLLSTYQGVIKRVCGKQSSSDMGLLGKQSQL